MVPNPTYSGPVKPTLKKFVELPFTSDSAEFNALVGGKVNVGYLPLQDITARPTTPRRPGPTTPGCRNFTLEPLYGWAHQLLPVQLQLDRRRRQRRDDLQASCTSARPCSTWSTSRCTTRRSTRATASPPTARCPCCRPNTFASPREEQPLPVQPVQGQVTCSTSHGWKVVPNGTVTCHQAGHRRQRVRGRHPEGRQAGLQPPVRHRDDRSPPS